MSAAAASFVEWLSATAAQAEESAAQAHAAAAGYETAFAMTVPPPVIAANRSLLAALVATNFFGQNTPAIAATEIAIRRNVGTGRRRDVRLRGDLGVRDHTVTVPAAAAEHRSGVVTASQAAAVGQAASSYRRRCAKRGFVCATGLFRGAASTARPGDVPIGSHRIRGHRPVEHVERT